MQLRSVIFGARDWNSTVKTVFGILGLLAPVLLLTKPATAFQTALVRASDGATYQIRFHNRDVGGNYDLGYFIDDFSVYDETGKVKLCLDKDETVTWEVYTAARVLAKTQRNTPIFNTSELAQALAQAIEDQDLAPTEIAEKLAVSEVVGKITSGIQGHTFLKSLSIVPKSGPVAIIAVPATLIAKLGNIEIRMRKLLYAFWMASVHAETAIVLQEIANKKAAELWDAINRGQIVDIFGGPLNVDIESREVSGDLSIDVPLRLRFMAQIHQENAEGAAELGADLGKSENAWFKWLTGLTGVGAILELLAAPVDAIQLKNALEDLEASSGERVADLIERNIEEIYNSAAFDLNWHGFCVPNLGFNLPASDVPEGYGLTYTVTLNSPPKGVARIAISSSNPDATVLPTSLTFTAIDWYKPKTVRMITVEDADHISENVYLTHTAIGYGSNLALSVLLRITDRKGNKLPELIGTIPPLTLSLDDDFRLDLDAYFRDPEGDKLIYSHNVIGQNFDVVDVSRNGSTSWITITPRKLGSTTVSVWAVDPDGLQNGQTFTVTVTAAPPQTQPPEPIGTISHQTLTAGGTAKIVDVSAYFSDPDGDVLTYTAWTDTPSVVELRREGSLLTIRPKIAGTATVRVRATDPDGLHITQRFTVTVTDTPLQNRNPETVGTIPAQAMTVGTATSLQVSGYFRDPDGDNLTYTAQSNDTQIATVSVSGTYLTITPRRSGNTTVIVAASDGSLTAIQHVSLTIIDAPLQNRAPRVLRQIPAHTLTVDNSAALLPLSSYFSDPDGDSLTYTASTGNTIVATVSRSGSPVLITPVAAGTAIITVTASDGKLQATQSFVVTITANSQQNQVPEVSRWMNLQNFRVGDAPKWRNLSSYFSDPDGDALTYTAISSNTGVVAVSISGNSVKITPKQPGTATVTLTARDTEGLTAAQDFRVTVQTKLETIPSLPVCNRTPQIRDEILKRTRVKNCEKVTEDDLESIRRLSLIEEGLVTLQQGDFDELRSLEDLVLNGNFLRTLPEDIFWYLGKLQKLGLKNNQITILVEDTFEHLDSLTDLTLYGNQITTLQEGAFNDLDNLIELDLRENQLTILPEGVFEDLSNLEELDLENNQIAILSRGGFLGLSSLEDLELGGNPLHTIEAEAFNGLSNLTDLDLNNYPLHTIEAGAFSGLSNLTDLNLGDTQLRMLQRDTFLGLSSLEDLELDGNPLHTIEAGAFSGLSNLNNLYLNDTQLRMLQRDTFLGLSSLEDLELDGNPLHTIEAGAFNGLSNLLSLDLGENQLAILPVGIFSGLNRLTRLRLDQNQFTTLPANIFNGLSDLQLLDLGENRLVTLPTGVFKHLSNLTRLNLWDNPGAPFTLTLELARTDNTNPEAAGPATVKVKLAEGAPFDMNIPLSVEDGTLSANTATLTSGQTESDPITVTQTGTNFATVRLDTAPTVPQNYLGIQMAIGTPLVLFSEQDTPAEVRMPDANLRAAVRTTLGLGTGNALTQQALLGLKSLKYLGPDLRDIEKIKDLTGLEHALNLEHLDLYAHLIRDLRPLENLANLKSLWLAGNKITDIRPLTNLPIERLDLGGNPITDFTPLADLTRLTRLDFWGNELGDSDLIHITELTLLTRLDLRSNKITSVTDLTQLVNLEKLSLKGNPISNLSPLRELLRQNPNVEIDIEIDTEAKSADLMIQGEPQVSQTTVAPGETFQIDTSVWNRGRGASSDTILRYYLSADETLSSEDMEVASHPVGPLHGRGADNNRRRAEVSDTLTAPETPGVHYYIVCIDEVAGEPDILNNCSQAITITVEAPAPPSDPIPPENPQDPNDSDPVELEGPDLVISATRVDASTIKVFAGIRLHITLTNQGTETAAATMIRYYRSEDATISAEEDTELRAVPVGQLGAGQSYMTWAPLPGSTSVGVYYYGACLDGVATEVDTSNNCSDAIQITVIPPHEDTTTLRPNGTISQQALEVGDTPVVIDMSRYFVGTVETWTANSSKTDVVTASMSDSEVILTAVKDGWATVTIEASHEDLRAQQTFAVSVGGVAPGLVPIGTIPTQELEIGSSPAVLDVSGYFIGEVQTWTASTEQTHRLKVSMAGSSVTLTPVGNGWATVVIEASREDLRARQTFRVSVDAVDPADHNPFTPLIPSDPTDTPDVSPEVSIPDEQLRRDIRGTLGLEADDTITQQKMKRLTKIKVGGPPPEVIFDLTGLEYAINLRELDVSYSQLSDITPLANLTALKTFRLTGSQLSDITPLANLTALTWLNIGYNSQLSDITPLANLTALTYLNLEKNQISDVTPLKNLTKLTYLNIFDNQLSDISALTGLTKLMSLVLENNYQISDISALAGLTKLTQLSLHNNKISDVTPLQNLTALTRLTLHGNQIADINPLASLTSLTTVLTLHQNQISDVTALGGLTSLTRLDLRWNQIKDVTPLEGLTSLTALSLANNPIEDLAPLRRLKEKNPNVSIDIDINVGAAPSAPHLPAETALLPNYPNPFNPETWIPYQLAEGADVTVTLYDVRGVMVRRLVVGHRHAGVYQSRGRAAHWDGRNALGEKVASGLYLYRFTAGDFTATGKLLIRK